LTVMIYGIKMFVDLDGNDSGTETWFIYSTHIEFFDKIKKKGCLEVSIMDKSKYPPYISKKSSAHFF
jgi:hypothetical protein